MFSCYEGQLLCLTHTCGKVCDFIGHHFQISPNHQYIGHRYLGEVTIRILENHARFKRIGQFNLFQVKHL